MADYCRQCTRDFLGKELADQNDMRGLCGSEEMAAVLCEGCGVSFVLDDGTCIGPCRRFHENGPAAQKIEREVTDAERASEAR